MQTYIIDSKYRTFARVTIYIIGLCILALGLTKNIVDITCVTITCIMTMAAAHRIIGVGAGTLIAMLGIGRVIAMINKLFGKRLIPLAAPQTNDIVND